MATCQDCGKEADKSEGRVVGDAGPYGPVCNECWALLLKQETVLSDREAQVAALLELGLPRFEIADTLTLDESTVRTYCRRIREKIHRAERTVDEVGGLFAT